jgi:hypothetical protein
VVSYKSQPLHSLQEASPLLTNASLSTSTTRKRGSNGSAHGLESSHDRPKNWVLIDGMTFAASSVVLMKGLGRSSHWSEDASPHVTRSHPSTRW